MKAICIGIPVSEQPEQLRVTLDSLSRNTSSAVRIILLPDGPDSRMTALLANLAGYKQLGTADARGVAACFNRLASATEAEILMLLETGAQVGPGWLDHLLAALDADPQNGLAGPTTNNCWNEQGVYPQSGDTAHHIANTAREAANRFGDQARTLEPLYSLADFCYVVRREVIEVIGAADENYGLGPCWEMDYNIRAARAGWRGVWAGAAYVHRAPFTSRRRFEEGRRFEVSKHYYQDKYCGGRLRGEKSDYREHCRGDACDNFAPPALIQLHRPLPQIPASEPEFPVANAATITTSEPLVSCIMPTCNRRAYVPQAIRCFLRQDYANLELVIVDDGSDAVAECVPESERVRYIRLDQKMTLGAKRNFACEQARGEFIFHWDDDDWYPSWRVSRQMAALLEGGFDLCGSSRVFYWNADTEESWEYCYAASGPKWVAGNTLGYRRSFWNRNRFPEIQVGEDSRFVWSGVSKTIYDLAEPGLCIATVHSGNTSRKEVNGACWHHRPTSTVHSLLGDDSHFYRVPGGGKGTSWPLVSCILPTYNRRRFIPQALEHFRLQDYPNRELIIVDDGQDGIGDLVEGLPGVRYLRLSARASIGAKRNLACQHAQGAIVAHWDDDDWYSADRLRYQVAPILAGKADITGLESAFVLELPAGEFWATNAQLHQQLFVGNVHGGTLVYRRELLAQGLRYPEINLAEDAYLLRYAVQRGKKLLRLSNPGVFVYVRHGTNAWREFAPGRFMDPNGWNRIARPANFTAAALAAYTAAAQVL